MGPFYCPLDQTVYIDLSFYNDLRQRLGAPGDFAQAYVIAHEVGHHVQNMTGTDGAGAPCAGDRAKHKPTRCRCGWSCRPIVMRGSGRITRNAPSRCSQSGDVEEALNAASAIGDDRLQRQIAGHDCAGELYARLIEPARALVPAKGSRRVTRRRATRSTREPYDRMAEGGWRISENCFRIRSDYDQNAFVRTPPSGCPPSS